MKSNENTLSYSEISKRVEDFQLKILNDESLDFDFSGLHEIQNQLLNSVYSKQDEILIEGLQRKGHQFNNKSEMIKFVSKYVRCDDNIYTRQKTFYVYDQPFLVQNYAEGLNFNTEYLDERTIIAKWHLGSFKFID